MASASASEALNTRFVFSGFEMTSHTVYEIGVWGKVWLGTRTLRGGKFAVLQSIDAGGEEGDYSRGWIEEWRLEETGEVRSFTRRSPSRDGWVLKAFGNSNAECPIWGGDTRLRVVEVWTKGEVSKDDALMMSGLENGEMWEWLL